MQKNGFRGYKLSFVKALSKTIALKLAHQMAVKKEIILFKMFC
jgi:hypothetical protein